MQITSLKTNHLVNPLGFELGVPQFSWKVTGTAAKKQISARLWVATDPKFTDIIFDTQERVDLNSLAVFLPADVRLSPRTRYYWKVWVRGDNGAEAVSEAAWFETSKLDEEWQAKWITPKLDPSIQPKLFKTWDIPAGRRIRSARAYICGLGLYELYLNGRKVGDEFLTPGYNAYDKWIQYQTYELDHLVSGENKVEVLLGDGWYKGHFGFGKGLREGELYGSVFEWLCELRITFEDGEEITVGSDDSWLAQASSIVSSGIYEGETFDANVLDETVYPTEKSSETEGLFDRLQARLSVPVVIKQRRPVEQILHSPAGEIILDMGQNMVGWLEIDFPALDKDRKVTFEFGEVLQDGNFYRENLNFAQAAYHFISDGQPMKARPHFTFYGFRYVRVTGFPEIRKEQVEGCVLYSDLEETSAFKTDHPLVNRLYENAKWSQRGNFVDTPTDCPQRSERLGWTGDAQVFAETACFNMDVYPFYTKYGHDLALEQAALNGSVPFIVPVASKRGAEEEHPAEMKRRMGDGSSGWGEAATVIPWKVWLHYGNKAILEKQYASMKAWVDYMHRQDEESGSRGLWTVGFHFGDWLALDNYFDPDSRFGGTEEAYMASIHYFYSTTLLSKAAGILGKTEDAAFYTALAAKIQAAMLEEYMTPKGRLAIQTQTALVLALYTELVPEAFRQRLVEDLRHLLKRNRYHLTTGFLGTPYLCLVLSAHQCNDIAYTLLLNEDYPSWLYPVKMGATTIWERWNSIREDGTMNPAGMNSLNHYAYGSIVEWMFKYMAGLQPLEAHPGMKHIRIAPQPDYRIKEVKAHYDAAAGRYAVKWELTEAGKLRFELTIPFDCTAEVVLPDAQAEDIQCDSAVRFEQEGPSAVATLVSGHYSFEYQPTKVYAPMWSIEDPIEDLLTHPRIRELLDTSLPGFIAEVTADPAAGKMPLAEFLWHPFLDYDRSQLPMIKETIEQIRRS